MAERNTKLDWARIVFGRTQSQYTTCLFPDEFEWIKMNYPERYFNLLSHKMVIFAKDDDFTKLINTAHSAMTNSWTVEILSSEHANNYKDVYIRAIIYAASKDDLLMLKLTAE